MSAWPEMHGGEGKERPAMKRSAPAVDHLDEHTLAKLLAAVVVYAARGKYTAVAAGEAIASGETFAREWDKRRSGE